MVVKLFKVNFFSIFGLAILFLWGSDRHLGISVKLILVTTTTSGGSVPISSWRTFLA